jgi:uncharacterized protein YndB with AHSA1/START domain
MIDLIHQINAVERRVGPRTLAAGEARTITVSQIYDAGIEDVWNACTNPERLPRWFLPISGDLRVGGRYQFEGNAGGTIEQCDPPHTVAATWEYGDTVSWIVLRLTPESDDRTRVELEHTAHVDDHWTEFGPGAVGIGWDLALMGLSTHLASKAAVDAAEVARWSASEDGKEFMTQSSLRWCEADIASGTSAHDAQARAHRTTAAYTGS